MNGLRDELLEADVPIEILFTEDLSRVGKTVPHETVAWKRHNRIWADQPVSRLLPHVQLFDYLLGREGAGYPVAYVDWYNNLFTLRGLAPELDEEHLLDFRHRHFREAHHHYQRVGPSAAEFVLDVVFMPQSGKFYVLDGYHRLMFLYAMGARRIRCRMSSADRDAWLRLEAAHELAALIARQGRRLVYTPLLHPDFYDQVPERDFAAPTRLELIHRFMGAVRFEGPIADIGSNIGHYTHALMREGADVTGFEPFAGHHALAEGLSKLYGLDASFRQAGFEACSNNDVFTGALMLTVFYHVMARGEEAGFLRALDNCVSDYVFWESGHDPEAEKILITGRTHLSHYRHIAWTFGTGRHREFGVFFSRYVGYTNSLARS